MTTERIIVCLVIMFFFGVLTSMIAGIILTEEGVELTENEEEVLEVLTCSGLLMFLTSVIILFLTMVEVIEWD